MTCFAVRIDRVAGNSLVLQLKGQGKRVLLKDEACADGRQDHSSGVILQGRSGLRQDSSGSTKQGKCRPPIGLRDVDIRNLHVQNSPLADLTYELRSHNPGNNGAVEDTSSE